MRLAFFIAFIPLCFAAKGQTQLDTLEGWWTIQDGQHYFEDQTTTKIKFVGEEVWGMEDYYAALVPQIGFVASYNHCCQKKKIVFTLKIYTLIQYYNRQRVVMINPHSFFRTFCLFLERFQFLKKI